MGSIPADKIRSPITYVFILRSEVGKGMGRKVTSVWAAIIVGIHKIAEVLRRRVGCQTGSYVDGISMSHYNVPLTQDVDHSHWGTEIISKGSI